MTQETINLQKSKERLEEIADKFKNNRVQIDEILPLIEESVEHKTKIMERLDMISKALDEKIEKEDKAKV
jgi:glutamate racemase